MAETAEQKVVFNGYGIGYNCVMGATHSLPKRLGDFEINREIGRGGMGVVYEARQVSLNRRVALKVLSSGLGLTAKAVQRFRREAEAAARLHHTNIVPIYATGEEHGVHFYAMELIEGPSLDQVIRHLRDGNSPAKPSCAPDSTVDSPAPSEVPTWLSDTLAYSPATAERATVPFAKSSDATGSGISSHPRYYDQVASMMAEVADALQHAHDEGVIHRDIKPSNLLLSPDGRLSLNDFGLARVLEQPGMTLSGEFVGSPLYMSPEQITAGRAPLDHRTDIYSLGATLYELLTWEPPFPGRLRDQIIAQILHKEPQLPRRRNGRIPLDLETICLKAIEKDPDRRYMTAGQMGDDLRRYVNRFAISARRTGLWARGIKWARRNRTISVLLLLLIAAVGFAALLQWRYHADRQAQIAELKKDALSYALSGSFEESYDKINLARALGVPRGWLHLMEGQLKMLQGDYGDARVELEEAVRLLGDTNAAAPALLAVSYGMTGQEDEFLRRLASLQRIPGQEYHDHLLKGWAFSVVFPRIAKTHFDKARASAGRNNNALLVLESIALTRNAMDISEPRAAQQDIQAALTSTAAVLAFREHDLLARSWHAMASCVAARIYDQLKDHEKADFCMRDAEADVQLLRQWPAHADARWARAVYLDQVGRVEDMIEDFAADVNGHTGVDNYLAVWLAAKFFARGDFERCRWALDQIHGNYRQVSQYAWAYVQIPQIKTEGDRTTFLRDYMTRVERERHGRSDSYWIFDWSVARILGDAVVAQRIAMEYRRSLLQEIYSDGQLAASAYLLENNPMKERELLRRSQPSQFDLSRANFVIAINRLGDWARDEARSYFEAVLRSRYRETIFGWWSEAFLAHLSDPDWLPWLKALPPPP